MLIYLLLIILYILMVSSVTRIEYRSGNRIGFQTTDKPYVINRETFSVENIEEIKLLNYEKDVVGVSGLPYLTQVNISGFPQMNIPQFYNLPKIKKVYLLNNNIAYVSPYRFTQTNVSEIYIGQNRISLIEDASFGNNVQTLWMECNKLTHFEASWFENPSKLVFLVLDGNRIPSLQKNVFKTFTALSTLWMSFNGLLTIEDGAFSGRNTYNFLSLGNNNLKVFNPTIFPEGNITIERLHLDFNQLTYLSSELMAKLEVIQPIPIDGNPWQCSCYYNKIIHWISWHQYTSVNNRAWGKVPRKGEPRCIAPLKPTVTECNEEVDQELIDTFNKESAPYSIEQQQYCRCLIETFNDVQHCFHKNS